MSARRTTASEKPVQCPSCDSGRIASIVYGMPAYDADMERDLQAGVVVLGGCIVTRRDPAWQCSECGLPIYRAAGRARKG